MHVRDSAAVYLASAEAVHRVLTRQEARPVRRVWDAATADAAAELDRAAGRRERPLDAGTQALLLALALALLRRTVTATTRAHVALLGQTLADGAAAVDRVARAHGVMVVAADRLAALAAERHRAELAAARERSMAALETAVATDVRRALAGGVVRAWTTREASGAVADVLARDAWMLDRVTTTEAAAAHNIAALAVLQELDRREPGVWWGRWTELVDDVTGRPLDNRVGIDSMVLHGQVARPGDPITMPDDDDRAPVPMIGQSWRAPPNRPHDRSCLLPWRRGWPVPAWAWLGGRRVVP